MARRYPALKHWPLTTSPFRASLLVSMCQRCTASVTTALSGTEACSLTSPVADTQPELLGIWAKEDNAAAASPATDAATAEPVASGLTADVLGTARTGLSARHKASGFWGHLSNTLCKATQHIYNAELYAAWWGQACSCSSIQRQPGREAVWGTCRVPIGGQRGRLGRGHAPVPSPEVAPQQMTRLHS